MENNKFTEKLFTYTAEQKLELAEEMMSQFGSRIASIDGKLKAYLDMKWNKIEGDDINVKINKRTLEEVTNELDFLKDLRSRYIQELLKK